MLNRVLTCLLVVLMFLVGTTMTACTAEPNPTYGSTVEGFVIFPDENSVYISASETKVEYTGVCAGNSGVVVLRFTNENTGEVRNHTFICNNVYQINSINPFSEGRWHIELVKATCENFDRIFLTFS